MTVDVEEDYRPPPTTFIINVRKWTDNNKRTTCWLNEYRVEAIQARLNYVGLRVNLSVYSVNSTMESGTNLDK